jgi:putative Ca2+/H+ antiporter (TMEM165/GDT1 family)
MLYLLLATYGTVFFAELLGDKTIYTISTLTTRFRPSQVFCGISAAFMCKMLAAVLVGRAIAELPPMLVAGISAATFFTTAFVVWRKKPKGATARQEQSRPWSRVILICFAAVFFSEWCDVGQITAATLVARYQAPVIVWLGATLALNTKGVLAMTLGLGLRKHVPHKGLRYGLLAICLTMGVITLLRIDP